MSLVPSNSIRILMLLTLVGCQSSSSQIVDSPFGSSPPASGPSLSPESTRIPDVARDIQLVSYQNSISPQDKDSPSVLQIEEVDELSLERLIAEVQSIHPSVEAMYAAWQAAADRYPQVVSLDDPMFGATFAPTSFHSLNVESAYVLELSQKLPWYGKRALRGALANAEADSADHDIETTRQKLAELTELAFWEYYVVRQQLELNQQAVANLQALRDNAKNRYQTGLVTSQDVLQADIELATLEQRRIELERMERVAAGRINILLRRGPMDHLQPPSKAVAQQYTLPEPDVLFAFAIDQRPEVAAAAARVQAEEAKLCLAYKDFYPDTELFGRYDTFWQPRDTQSELRSQVGVRINLPIYRSRLNAAVCGASHLVARARAEYEQIELDVQSDVQLAYEKVRESQRTLDLYSKKFSPAAEQNVSAARANYDTAKINFLDLAVAQRQLIETRERQLQAQVELRRGIATLRRVTGGTLPVGLPPSRPDELLRPLR